MKKFFLMLAICASACTVISCSSNGDDDIISPDEDNVTNNIVNKSFTISNPSSTTRSYVNGSVDAEQVSIHWATTDQLRVWADKKDAQNNGLFRYDESRTTSSSNYAIFSGSFAQSDIEGISKYYILYPYQSGASVTDGAESTIDIVATIPSQQTATAGGFDPAADVCVGSGASNTTGFTLDHACAFLKITTTEPTQSITVTSGSNIAGTVNIGPKSAGAAIGDKWTNGSMTVTLVPSGTNTSFEAGTYLIAIAASTKTNTITVAVKGATKTKTQTLKNAMQFAAGSIYNLGSVTVK